MIIAQLSIAPVGKDVSLHNYVQIVIDILKKENMSFETNAMATVIESDDLSRIFDVVQKAHLAILEAGAYRVITELKIDDRRDKEVTMKSKIKSLK
ncbi:MAG: MTH1187 family thiamine-binding protein [Thermoplasmatota archaeon]